MSVDLQKRVFALGALLTAALALSGVVIFTLFVTGYQMRESWHRSRPARPLPPGTAS